MTGWLRVALVLAVLTAAVALGFQSLDPPAPRPASAPEDQFSAERAMESLAYVGARPHPTGTESASAVRDFIVARMKQLDFDVSVQEATSINERYVRYGYPVVAGHVRNVIARRHGRSGGPTVLLEAHYDSRELAPGASDDGYGVAVLLETARALRATPPPLHDVILLFTEGEEQGLLGAKAFARDDALSRDIAVVVNVDTRGSRGAGLMFETSDRASDLVETLARVTPRVTAASLAQEVYRRMPNDTDLSVWLAAGRAGMNFGSIDGFERYHQPTDTVANADPGTVQQLGDGALAMIRALADRDPVVSPADHDDVYFDLGRLFVRYDSRAALPIGAIALAGLIAATIVGLRRRLVTARGVLLGMAATLVLPVLAGALAWLLLRVSTAASPELLQSTVRGAVRHGCLGVFLLLGAGVAWLASVASFRRAGPTSLWLGACLLPATLAVLSAWKVPGASFPFTWASLAASAAAVAWTASSAIRSRPWTSWALHLAPPAIACLVAAPLVWQVAIAFGPAAGPALAALGALVVLPAPMVTEARSVEGGRFGATTLLAAAAALWVSTVSAPPFDAGSPRPDSLVYAVDDDAGRATWLSMEASADAWTAQVLGRATLEARPELNPRHPERRMLGAPAPMTAHRGPHISVLSDTTSESARTLRLHVSLAPGTEGVELFVPPVAKVRSARVEEASFGLAGDGWLDLAYAGPPEDGLDFEVTTAPGPVSLTVVAQSRGLPVGVGLQPRPEALMPEVSSPTRASDMTLTSSSFQL